MSVASLVLAFAAVSATQAHAQTFPLNPGDLVVSVYGNAGTTESSNAYLDGNPTPISLEEFSSTVPASSLGTTYETPVLSESLPDSGTGTNVGIVGEYGSSSEGTIQVSGNGQDLTIGGYDANAAANGIQPQTDADNKNAPYATGTAYSTSTIALGQSNDGDVPRVAAVINISTGTVDTSTALNDIYDDNNPRSVYSPNGSTLLFSGQGQSSSVQGGIFSTTEGTDTAAGGTAPTAIYVGSSTRVISQAKVDASQGTTSGANTYYSMDQNSRGVDTAGIFEYAGTPTGSQGTSMGTRITPATVTVKGTSYNLSPEGFFFANATTLYVADTGTPKGTSTGNALGGIQKWSFSSANNAWALDYTLQYNFPSVAQTSTTTGETETGFASLAGQVVNGQVELYATSYTSSDDAPDGLYAVTDTLTDTTAAQASNEAIVELAASAPDSDFKGVAFIPDAVPEPSTYALLFGSIGFLIFLARRKTAFKV